MRWEPIILFTDNQEGIQLVPSTEGIRISFWKGDLDQSARSANIPWNEWERLATIIKALNPQSF